MTSFSVADETILLVEDEEEVRKLAARVLERQGYRVLQALHGDKAFQIHNTYDGEIHLLVTDVVMPKISGRELADRIVGNSSGDKGALYVRLYR